MAGELLVPCPFNESSYCGEKCPNFFDNLVVTAEVANDSDLSFEHVVNSIIRSIGNELTIYRMKMKHLEAASMCANNIKN